MKSLLLFPVIVGVLGIAYVFFRAGEKAGRRKAAGVPEIFSLSPGAVTREICWKSSAESRDELLSRAVAALRSLGANLFRQEASQAIVFFGSRTEAKMHGLWNLPPLQAPTRVLLRVEGSGEATALRLRLDEDLGFQMFMGPLKARFHELYNSAFDQMLNGLRKELKPLGESA